MAKPRKHEYASAGPNDPSPAVGLDALLENTGSRNRASFGVQQAEKTHSRKEIKQAIRNSIRQARAKS